MEFADHFSGAAPTYAAFRPSYPPAFISYLAALSARHDLAWDAGTGSGQAAVLLGDHYTRVIATDASATQIAGARAHPHVTYRVGLDCESGLPDSTVDLVTVAQALHWFDRPRFYAEVRRVLKPGGIIAVWCYGRVHVEGAAGAIVDEFYRERVVPYWPVERHHVETLYKEIDFPFTEIAPPAWAMTATPTRGEFLGYLRSWSAVAQARKIAGIDLVTELEQRLASVWPSGSEHRRTVSWPIGLRVGK